MLKKIFNSLSFSSSYNNRLLFALFLHSLSIIGFQIILMRLLSFIQWDHFANMIISIAMLGFGVSGTLLAITGKRIIKYHAVLVPLFMIGSSILMIIAYRLSQNESLIFDTFLVFSSTAQLLKFVLFLFLFFLPFFAAAFSIGLIYIKFVKGIGKLYFSNLIGSGIGGIIGLLLLYYMLPHNALYVVAFFPVFAASILFTRKYKYILSFSFLLFLIINIWNITNPVSPKPSQYKDLARTMLMPDAEVSISESGISSQVSIVESKYLRYAPGLSLQFVGQVPSKPMAFVNGNSVGFIPHYCEQSGGGDDILRYTPYMFPYIMGNHNSVAVIGSGTGTFVAQALRNNAKQVYAIEPEISLINVLKTWHENNFKSVYDQDNVSLHNIQARAFFYNYDKEFDLIVLPPIGSFGGTSGLHAIQENYALTLEALETYWNSLSSEGYISVTAYTDFPPKGSLKILASLVEMLRNCGIEEPGKHIAAIRSWTAINFTISKKEITPEKSEIIRGFSGEMGFDPFILSDIEEEERTYFNYIDNKELFEIADKIIAGDKSEVFDDYLFYIKPAVDNKPYFSRFVRISKINELLKEYPLHEIPFIELGYIIVWLTLIIAIIFAIVLILLPVAWFKKSSAKMPVLLYFGCLGIGFMFVEIILIQRFVLFLEQPVYSITAVLSSMMVFSGIGSYFSGRVKIYTRQLYYIFASILVILIFYNFYLTSILNLMTNLGMTSKIFLTILIVGVPAFFMGMPFPMGLKLLSNLQQNDKLAWAYGINGFFSVIATPLALIVAIEKGYVIVISIAAVTYFVALIALKVIAVTRKN